MSRYHPLRVARIRQETPECVSVWLDVPAELKSEFAFAPGQYLNCRAMIGGEEVRKSYSICTIPEDPNLAVAVKLVHNGRMSTYLNQVLKPGDVFEVMPPEGKFTLPDNLPEDASVVFFAAGSGITPVMSLIRSFLLHYPKGNAVLFYSNRTSESIIFRDELEALKNEYMTRFSIYHVLTKEVTGVELLSGRIDHEKCAAFARHFFDPKEADMVFICGPELMIHDVREQMIRLGVKNEQIRFELFGTVPMMSSVKHDVRHAHAGEDKVSKVTIRIDGHEADFHIHYNGEAVLDAALHGGLDMPYSCKGGVCSTCKAQVVEGKVSMDIHYGLEPDEIDAGIVLTCQSHPRSERVILDYDIL